MLRALRGAETLQFCTVTMPDKGLRTLVLSGGVARNRVLRTQYVCAPVFAPLPACPWLCLTSLGAPRIQALCVRHGLDLAVPPPQWCSDNATMIAWAGIEWLQTDRAPSPYTIDYRPTWPLAHASHP
jgi:tRNA A37 threonylcarbamoyltransferase TsaD